MSTVACPRCGPTSLNCILCGGHPVPEEVAGAYRLAPLWPDQAGPGGMGKISEYIGKLAAAAAIAGGSVEANVRNMLKQGGFDFDTALKGPPDTRMITNIGEQPISSTHIKTI